MSPSKQGEHHEVRNNLERDQARKNLAVKNTAMIEETKMPEPQKAETNKKSTSLDSRVKKGEEKDMTEEQRKLRIKNLTNKSASIVGK